MRLIDADRLTEAVEEIDWYHLNNIGEMVHGANSDYHQPWYKYNDIHDAIRNAPTVDAVPVWIPVEDRLPEDTEDEFNCFITVTSSILNRFIMEAHYVNCLEEWSKEYTGERRGAWMAWDREDCEFFEVDNVIAWMPMIKPYREDEQ